ncbi:hypothetical protein D3C87_965690 [compost metagenome]
MRLKRLAALPLVLLLAGCPNLLGSTGNTELNPKALAVTQNTGAGATANAYVEWQPVTNASLYQVLRTTGQNSDSVQKSDKTHFSEQVGVGSTITYKIVALDASGNEKTTSTPISIQVLASEVAAPGDITVDGKKIADDKNITSVATGKPAISWSPAEKATHYYVKITDEGDKTLFAALTKEPQLTVGALPFEDLKVPHYTQVKGDGIPAGKVVKLMVSAIRANDADLKVATAYDIKASAAFDLYRK